LDKKIREFLKLYDENEDKEIEIDELTNERSKLIEDLVKGKEGSKI